MSSLIFSSFAKINLGLKIINKRVDGYHNLYSLFLELDLHDTLTFEESEEFLLTTSDPSLPVNDTNLICKAYHAMLPHKTNAFPNYKVHMEKVIPIGGGLGGGSSNAACAILALNGLWKCNLTIQKLKETGAAIGADVAFFIEGGFQLAEGIGDRLTPVDPTPLTGLTFLLVVPDIYISTPWAYKSLNIHLQGENDVPKFAPLTMPVNWQLFENDFERVIRSTYPEIDEIKSQLYASGAIFAGLSGSGSTVFGIFDTPELAQESSAQFSACRTFITFLKTK